MSKLLWEPSEERKQRANITHFTNLANKKYGLKIHSHDELYDWSVTEIPNFWTAVWEYCGVKVSRPYNDIVDNLTRFPGAKWFDGARLNFAENLLRYRDNRTAFIFRDETHKSVRRSYAELYDAVARLARPLLDIGLKPGDRVAAYMPNLPETAIAMLATTSTGAIWSSCATDLGAQATLDRIGQLGPRVLFTVDGYFYKGKPFSSLSNVAEIASKIPSLEKVVIVRYTESQDSISHIPNAIYYDQFIAQGKPPELRFEQLPADHPVYIMFSSGTTGKPKCIVQGAGGILINHLKELILHIDLKREDVLFQITTCSWMMWNWMLSSLAVGNAILIYDGNPAYPDIEAMWRIIQDEKVTVFGTSASYINLLKSEGFQAGKKYNLPALREICQTGSVLSAEGFEYIYDGIKRDLHFNSISGGTDINGCFAEGNPTVPVYAGEIQKAGLGMKVKSYDERGNAVLDQMGELVCEAPAPSMPLYFWNDPGGEKYKDAYFGMYPNVWRHGDYIMVHSDTRGITFFGRSDALLKPSGVRIGTAEIYSVLESISEIADTLAIGQPWQDDQRIILFVKLAKEYRLTDELRERIRKTLREKASPRHVPAKIIQTPDIPYTLNMKKVESAVTNILGGKPVLNRDALMNPESLEFYEKIQLQLQAD
ncbi:MAG: acetoacetate--CoA ligase [Chloroflexi bacterium]|nr:acetoacetate--CoA ligase [Chloroflexota bacterium]